MTESIETKVARIEERQTSLKTVVDEIKNNHLVHIQTDIDKLHKKVDRMAIKIASFTGGFMVIIFSLEKLLAFIR